MKRIILYILIFVGLLYAFKYFHYHNLLSAKIGFYNKYNTIFNKSNNCDVLFLGSSRAQMHYNTKLADSILKFNSFNVSYNGANIEQAFNLLKCYLQKSKTPKTIFYEIDYHVLKYHENNWMDFQNLFPFIENENTYKIIGKSDKRFFYAKNFIIYAVANLGIKNINTGFQYFFNKNIKSDSLYYKGYFKNNLQIPQNKFSNEFKYQWFNLKDRAYLDSIIYCCKLKNIKLNLITSPIFGGGKLDVLNHSQIINQLKNIALINKISYRNLSSLKFCNQRNLFIDQHHMNDKGANLFTEFLCKELIKN
jgi:hypothetical protein